MKYPIKVDNQGIVNEHYNCSKIKGILTTKHNAFHASKEVFCLSEFFSTKRYVCSHTAPSTPLAPSILSLHPTRTRVCIPTPLWLVCSWWEAGVACVCGKKRWLLWCEEQWWLALGEWLWDASDHCLASWRCRWPNWTKHWCKEVPTWWPQWHVGQHWFISRL